MVSIQHSDNTLRKERNKSAYVKADFLGFFHQRLIVW